MCSHEEWETFRRRFDEGIGERQVREFVVEAAARIEAFVEELKGRACAPEDADRPADAAGGHGPSGSSGIAGYSDALRRAAGGLRPPASLARRELNECHDTAGHEPGCSYGFARTGHLDDFDNASRSAGPMHERLAGEASR
jgi:hypothetical protein